MTHFIDNKYTRWYYQLCQRGQTRTTDQYTESHHIIPEAFFKNRSRNGPAGWLDGDPDAADNFSELTDREHELAHYLLTKMCSHHKPAYYKVLKGYEMRSMVNPNQSDKRHFSSRRLAGIRAERARLQSEMMTGENNPNWGKFWTEEQKITQGNKVRGEKNGMKTEEARQAMRELKTGVSRGEFSQECIANMSAAKQGEKNPMAGKNHTDDSKKMIADAMSDRVWIHKNTFEKKVKIDSIQKWLDEGWTYGRRSDLITNRKAKPRVICEHCGTDSPSNAHVRYHGERCKHKK